MQVNSGGGDMHRRTRTKCWCTPVDKIAAQTGDGLLEAQAHLRLPHDDLLDRPAPLTAHCWHLGQAVGVSELKSGGEGAFVARAKPLEQPGIDGNRI